MNIYAPLQKLLKKLPDNIYHQSKNYTYYKHSNNREIEACIFRFNFNIARKIAKPFKLIMKKVNQHTGN